MPKLELRAWLTGRCAPGSVTLAQVAARAGRYERGLLLAARLIELLAREGGLVEAVDGVWLNAMRDPPGRLEDALAVLRPGAVASLHSSLGSAGLLARPSLDAFGVFPESLAQGGASQSVASIACGAAGALRFFPLPDRFFDLDASWFDAAAPYPRFAPEKALLDWLWMSLQPGGAVAAPSTSCVDLTGLDYDKACSWAQRLDMLPAFKEWAHA